MPDTRVDMKEYAEAAGLRETDMPSAHHPLMENDDEIRNLSDLINARDDRTRDDIDARRLVNDNDLDIEEALTFPHKKRELTSADLTPTLSDFDGDARTASPDDDPDDASYMTRDDFESSMLDTDPDPNAGANKGETLGQGESRAPDLTGTVTGIARGMATHLPQDIGAGGFQIEEPEMSGDNRALDTDDDDAADGGGDTNGSDLDSDVLDKTPGYGDPDSAGGQIPTPPANPASRDDALDATRQLK